MNWNDYYMEQAGGGDYNIIRRGFFISKRVWYGGYV